MKILKVRILNIFPRTINLWELPYLLTCNTHQYTRYLLGWSWNVICAFLQQVLGSILDTWGIPKGVNAKKFWAIFIPHVIYTWDSHFKFGPIPHFISVGMWIDINKIPSHFSEKLLDSILNVTETSSIYIWSKSKRMSVFVYFFKIMRVLQAIRYDN